MPQESMTPKERWLAVLQRKTPDRVPMDYWGTDETMDKLMRHLGCSEPWEVFRKLHIDRVWSVHPEYVGPPIPDDYDVLGCGFRDISYGTGVYRECVYHPLAQYETVKEVEANYTWARRHRPTLHELDPHRRHPRRDGRADLPGRIRRLGPPAGGRVLDQERRSAARGAHQRL